MSDDKLFNDVYEVVWTNLGEHLFHTKIGENIRHTPLITIYKENILITKKIIKKQVKKISKM